MQHAGQTIGIHRREGGRWVLAQQPCGPASVRERHFATGMSVRGWNPLYVVDYYDLDWRAARFQLQPELLLNR